MLWLSAALAASPGRLHEEENDHGVPPSPARLWVDTDMGLDDARALLALCNGGGDRIAGFSMVEGSASRDRGAKNLLALLEYAGLLRVEVGLPGPSSSPLPSPPWREFADALAGSPFPDPMGRLLSEDLSEAWRHAAAGGRLDYLALGPLSNLDRMNREKPGALDAPSTLWIAADRIEEDCALSWNLAWDPASAERVLHAAGCVALLDLSTAAPEDAEAWFLSLADTGEAARWIRGTTREMIDHGHRIFACDSLAAAAVLWPEEVVLSTQRFRLERIDERGALLRADENGNVRIGRFQDAGSIREKLTEAWGRPFHDADPHADPSHGPVSGDLRGPEVERRLRDFHGHLGPYVVLGYRMGRLALAQTGSAGHFDLQARVFTPIQPPRSCLIDGVQLGSGCTTGKANLSVTEHDGPAYAVFEAESGRICTVRLKPQVPERVTNLIEELGVEGAGRRLLESSDEELFDWGDPK